MNPQNIFISYGSRDRSIADDICEQLESEGHRCWIAPRDLIEGKSWGESIVKAIDGSRLLVLILTHNSNNSRHVIREVERADSKQITVITLMLESVALNSSLQYFLQSDQWLDATKLDFASVLRRLKDAVRRHLSATESSASIANMQAQTPRRIVDARSDKEWARNFDEIPPDNWGATPGNAVTRFLRRILSDN